MIDLEDGIFKVLTLTNLSSIIDAAEQQAQDLTDIINVEFSVETSDKIITMLMTEGVVDRVNIRVGDVFG